MRPASIDHAAAAGALFTTPVPISRLKPEDRTCPICHEPYTDPPNPECDRQPSEQEWAVSVDMNAEWNGLKRCCGHIFGSKCLVQHLHASGSWSNKCPICRDVWFGSFEDDTRVSTQQQARQDRVPQASSTLRRSRRIADQMLARLAVPAANQARGSSRSRGASIRRQSCRPADFTQRLLEMLQVPTGCDEVSFSLKDVEIRLQTLYRSIE